MDFFTLSETRQSCRNYDTRPVELEKLARCIQAARLAPSACNSQPWHFTVVTRPDLAKQVAKLVQGAGFNRFAERCPAFIAVTEEAANLSARLGGLVKRQEYAQIDIGLATAHLCFAAAEQGLSTCIMGWFQEKAIKKLLGIPANKRLRLVVAVGYAAPDDPLRPKTRKPIEQIATYLK